MLRNASTSVSFWSPCSRFCPGTLKGKVGHDLSNKAASEFFFRFSSLGGVGEIWLKNRITESMSHYLDALPFTKIWLGTAESEEFG